MRGYAALTDDEWVEFLRNEGVTENVNFWSPGGKPLRNDLPGNRIYFYSRVSQTVEGKLVLGRRFVGSAQVVAFEALAVAKAWEKFGFGNGAPSLEEMLRRIGKFGSVPGQKDLASVIGCTVLDDLVWFEEPIAATSLGLEWQPSIVRGKSLDETIEIQLQVPIGNSPPNPEVLAALALQFSEAPPQRKEVVSKRIERNAAVVKFLKLRHPDKCQYCQQEFFMKRGGRARYCEVHHLKELGTGGLDVVDNCLVLCATCHRRFHYGDILVQLQLDWIVVTSGTEERRIPRNVISKAS